MYSVHGQDGTILMQSAMDFRYPARDGIIASQLRPCAQIRWEANHKKGGTATC